MAAIIFHCTGCGQAGYNNHSCAICGSKMAFTGETTEKVKIKRSTRPASLHKKVTTEYVLRTQNSTIAKGAGNDVKKAIDTAIRSSLAKQQDVFLSARQSDGTLKTIFVSLNGPGRLPFMFPVPLTKKNRE